MSAEVETMMYVGAVPWHGFGTYVGDENVDSSPRSSARAWTGRSASASS